MRIFYLKFENGQDGIEMYDSRSNKVEMVPRTLSDEKHPYKLRHMASLILTTFSDSLFRVVNIQEYQHGTGGKELIIWIEEAPLPSIKRHEWGQWEHALPYALQAPLPTNSRKQP